MREVLDHYRPKIEASDVLERLGLEQEKYFIVSLHREENVDSKERLGQLVAALNGLARAYGYPIILSTHPRTRKRLDAAKNLSLDPRVRDLKPFGFHDYNHLQIRAFCAISDSGTIAEESAILGFAAITPRDAIERPEAMDTGNMVVTGLDSRTIAEAVELVTATRSRRVAKGGPCTVPADYQVTDTSERVVKLILGTARLSNGWDGIRMHDYV